MLNTGFHNAKNAFTSVHNWMLIPFQEVDEEAARRIQDNRESKCLTPRVSYSTRHKTGM